MKLRHFVHERRLLADPLKVEIPTDAGTKTTFLSSDLWLDIGQKSLRHRYCNSVELNLTEISQNRWREVVRKYLYRRPAYKERFGTDLLTVLGSIQTATGYPIKSLTSLARTGA